jgi:glycosyltransferase involved in cell wall biosynthesis
MTRNPELMGTSALGPVLLVTPWYRPAVGGVVEVADRLHHGLSNAGVATHLLVGGNSKLRFGIAPHERVANAWYFSIPAKALGSRDPRRLAGALLRGSAGLLSLARFMRRRRIRNVILIYPIENVWPFLILHRWLDIRLIASLHGNDVVRYPTYSLRLQRLLKRLLLRADTITVCGAHLTESVGAITHGRTQDVRLIPNSVDTSFFTPPPPGYARRSRVPTILHVSNFAPKKRTVDILEAFAHPAMPADARLVMVGAGPELEATRRRASELGIADRIAFRGAHADVRPFFWEADVFVLASDSEGAPLVLLEAMACGVPWVSTRWGPVAELPDGECGLAVPIGSPGCMAEAIAQLLRDPERRQVMGQRARTLAKDRYGELTYIERHLELLQ